MDGGLTEQEVRAAKTGVPFTALGVEDPEGRPLTRGPVSIAGDHGLRALADDVAPEPDPGPPGELQAESGRFGHGGLNAFQYGGQKAAWPENICDFAHHKAFIPGFACHFE